MQSMLVVLSALLLAAVASATPVGNSTDNLLGLIPCTSVDPNGLTASCGGYTYSLANLQPANRA